MIDGRRAGRWALCIYALFLGFILLGPSAEVPSDSVSVLTRAARSLGAPAALLESGRIEFVANVLIIVPVSLLGTVVWPRLNWRDWTAVGFVLAGTVELFQAVFLAQRSAAFVDVAANTLGSMLGAIVGVLVHRRLMTRS